MAFDSSTEDLNRGKNSTVFLWYPRSPMRRLGPFPLALLALSTSLLACQAATRLIFPPTASLSIIPAATPQTPQPANSIASTSCPDETASIMQASNAISQLSGLSGAENSSNQDAISLVTYKVVGDQIGIPVLGNVPDSLKDYQKDFALQKQSWDLFAKLIPAPDRKLVEFYQVITDGPDNILAAVKQTSKDPSRWVLEIDIADAGNTKNLVYTLIHEFGHLLTLNSTQVPPDLKVFDNPESNLIYNQEADACPDYFTGEGCSLPMSYINIFFDRYWKGLYDEWLKIDNIQDDQRRHDRLDSFYDKYRDQFVDDYAVTDPAEDIAETWTFFVLSPKPEGQSISDQKIMFFYEYPNLVQLRSEILQNLCSLNP